MRTPDGALAWLEQQRASGSTAWHNMCESLCRQAYGLAAHYSSAELHAKAIPSSFRHGHETPSKGDLVLYLNGGYGHIVVCTGNGWECYTNDYGGRGKVTKTDARNLVSWCGATSWFVADAWWSNSNNIRTHEGDDMPLSEDDLNKIAKKVWDHAIKSLWDGNDKTAAGLLNQANYYAISGGLVGTIPATAATSPGSDSTAKRLNNAIAGVDEAVWAAPSRTLTSGGGGSTGLSDADVNRIAEATANVLYARLKA